MQRLQSIVRKLRLIAASDLANFDKVRYVLHAAGRGAGVCSYRLRDGMSVALRKGTTDSKVFDEIFVERAYAPCVAALPESLGRVTLIDLGANIGLSALFLTRTLEVVEIIAVEPDPDNFRLLSENLRRTGLANRATAVRAFAGAEHAFAELHDSGNGAWGMRMGALSDTGTPVLPLSEIASAGKEPLAAGAQVRHRRRRAAAIPAYPRLGAPDPLHLSRAAHRVPVGSGVVRLSGIIRL